MEVPHFKPNIIVSTKIRCLLILNLSRSKIHPRPPVNEHKNRPILIDWPNERSYNIPIAGSTATPGGRRLQLVWLIAKSFLRGCMMLFGIFTSPFIHCKDDFTCPPISSPMRTPSLMKGINETIEIDK